MSDPLVSIVTPSFNQAAFIEDTLLSVRNQDYRPIEHIVVDGGSTDGTLDILRRYDDEYPLTWISESDEGQSHAINKGFDRANGDIVGWLNSDDVYFDQKVISRVVRYFDELSADVIYGDVCLINDHGTVFGVSSRPDFDRDLLFYRNLIAQPATFFRRSTLGEERLDPELEYAMDYEFWLRLSKSYEFTHVADILAGFRMHESQKTGEVRSMWREGYNVSQRFVDENPAEISLFRDLVPTEIRRIVRNVSWTIHFIRSEPELAFSGEFASIFRMLRNVFPKTSDVHKGLHRVRKL